jgi:hypothetical protein
MKPNLIILTSVRGSVWQRSIGAYQIAHHCRQHGFTVQVIDFTDLFNEQELYKIIEKLAGPQLLAIGVSTTFYSDINEGGDPVVAPTAGANIRGMVGLGNAIENTIVNIKLKFPNCKIVAGGANSWQMVDNKLFDAVFHGYSEEALVKYLKQLTSAVTSKQIYPKKGRCEIINGDLEKFEIEKLNHRYTSADLIFSNETLPIEISRGCIFNCKFCSYPLNGKKKLDYIRDYQEIKHELEYNYKEFGTTNYFFTDDTFNDSNEKMTELHKMIMSLPFKIKFFCYLRIDLLHRFPEQIKLLKEMGAAAVVFGIESFNHNSAKSIGKGMHPDKIKLFLLELYYTHWNKQVSITCSMIAGLPGETEETLRDAFQWFRTDGRDICDNWYPLTLSTSSFYKSEFDKNYEKNGYRLNVDGELWISNTMKFSDAMTLSKEFNGAGMYNDNHPGSFLIMALLTHGYTMSELMSFKIKDMPWRALVKKRLRMAKEYKQNLFAL